MTDLCNECVRVFFFNQKTAYELRISDWSSDVCSSDLACVRNGGRLSIAMRPITIPSGTPTAPPTRPTRTDSNSRSRTISPRRPPTARSREIDRKSVVEGQSESVRVELGSRRIVKIIKTKTKIERNHNNYKTRTT